MIKIQNDALETSGSSLAPEIWLLTFVKRIISRAGWYARDDGGDECEALLATLRNY
jgi:hypothetical protein